MLEPTLSFYRGETLKAAASDIVLWPEVAIPSVDDYMERFIDQIGRDAHAAGQSIVFGILEREEVRGETRTYNALLLTDGMKRQSYRKQHLVPYGEYFPVPRVLREHFDMPFIPRTDLSPGAAGQPLLVHAADTPLATAIGARHGAGDEYRHQRVYRCRRQRRRAGCAVRTRRHDSGRAAADGGDTLRALREYARDCALPRVARRCLGEGPHLTPSGRHGCIAGCANHRHAVRFRPSIQRIPDTRTS